VELLRMRRTDSQLALEYYQAAMSDPVAHGVTPEKCGDTLTWPARDKPNITGVPIHVLMDLNVEKFDKFFIDLMSSPTPRPAH